MTLSIQSEAKNLGGLRLRFVSVVKLAVIALALNAVASRFTSISPGRQLSS